MFLIALLDMSGYTYPSNQYQQNTADKISPAAGIPQHDASQSSQNAHKSPQSPFWIRSRQQNER
jgi:hypothetical protein